MRGSQNEISAGSPLPGLPALISEKLFAPVLSPSSSLSVQVISRSMQRAENPMAHRFQELEADGKAVVAQALAIGDAGLGTKIARKRFERKMVIAVPAANGENAGAADADILGEGSLDPGKLLVTRDVNGNGHRNSFLHARYVKGFLHAAPRHAK